MAAAASESFGVLKDVTRRRLLEEMIRLVQPASGLKVIIVDQLSMRVLSAALRMYDITEENVTLVEKVDIARKPLPALDAIYFLTPTMASVTAMLADYERPEGKKPLYADAHLFFTSTLSTKLVNQIGASKMARLKRIKTFMDIHIEYLAYEQRIFHLDMPDSFANLYSPAANQITEYAAIARKLATLCISFGEKPSIRYAVGGHAAPEEIATRLNDILTKFYKSSPDHLDTTHPAGTVLILDRGVDLVAPVLHEFTYQAMLNDLLALDNDVYTYVYEQRNGERGEKKVLLNETDQLWPTVRHLHIADSVKFVCDRFNDFVRDNKSAGVAKRGSSDEVQSMADMSEAIKGLPQFKELLSGYSMHMAVMEQCLGEFNEQQLEAIGHCEQTMATGEDAEGKKEKNQLTKLLTLLNDPSISAENKKRLLLIYFAALSPSDSDRDKLTSKAKIRPADERVLGNLQYCLPYPRRAHKKKGGEDEGYELSRYVPAVKHLMEEALDGTLDMSQFPYVEGTEAAAAPVAGRPGAAGRGAASVRAGKSRWATKKAGGAAPAAAARDKGRLYVFVAGGVTMSEMRCAYEVTGSHGAEVIIGGTSIMTPKLFMEQLGYLEAADDGAAGADEE